MLRAWVEVAAVSGWERETVCSVLEWEKASGPANVDSDLVMTENCGGEMVA